MEKGKENARSKQINIDMNADIVKLFDAAPPLRQLLVTSLVNGGNGEKIER